MTSSCYLHSTVRQQNEYHYHPFLTDAFQHYLLLFCFFFFLNDTPPPEISPLPLHDALPICPISFPGRNRRRIRRPIPAPNRRQGRAERLCDGGDGGGAGGGGACAVGGGVDFGRPDGGSEINPAGNAGDDCGHRYSAKYFSGFELFGESARAGREAGDGRRFEHFASADG